MSFEDILKRGEQEIDRLVHSHQTSTPVIDQPIPPIPTAQEAPVTTPQPPQSAISDALHAMAADITANRLAAYLLEHRIGTALARTDAEHVIALIQLLEAAHQQAAVNVFTPPLVHTPDGGVAVFTPAGDGFPPAGQPQ